MRVVLLVAALLVLQPATGWAEWQLTPFLGATFGGTSSFLDLGQEAGKRKLAVGVGGTWLGTFIGVEGEIVWVPGVCRSAEWVPPAGVEALRVDAQYA